MVVGRGGIEGAAHFPWRHHRIEQWAGWNVDGREGGRAAGGGGGGERQAGGRRFGEVGCGPVCQSLTPACVRPSHPLSLFLGCFHRRYSYQCYVD